MSLLKITKLTKQYPAFLLDGVSFSIEKGEIVGFIGRNGAGKSTTFKSMLGFVHPDSGDVSFFGLPFKGSENEIKQRIGFVSGGVNYYSKSKISAITGVTKRFYKDWDEDAYRKYMQEFKLDERKTPSELSEGMKVKYALTLALSHKAELLILDEPTSGLDPVSRDELLDIFLSLRDKGIGILFSTHIITDLERCADRIIYIREGSIREDMTVAAFEKDYRLVHFTGTPQFAGKLIGARREREGSTAIIRTADMDGIDFAGAEVSPAALEEIMLHIERD